MFDGKRTLWWVAAAALVAGCAIEEAGSGAGGPVGSPIQPVPFEGDWDDDDEGIRTQGKYVLGETLDPEGNDPAYHVSIGPRAIEPSGALATVRFDGVASLAATDSTGATRRGADPWFMNVRLPFNGGGGELKIVGVRTAGPRTHYKLRYRALATDPWTDPCLGSEAIPMVGRWSRAGVHELTGAVTLACAGDGTGAKCMLWGYPPGTDPTSPIWKAHQSCVRMARFDICGNGSSTTRPGTPIQIYDYLGINPAPPARFEGVDEWPPPQNVFYYEAAWTTKKPVCVAKLRWTAIALDGPCNVEFPDPRTDPTVDFCVDEAAAGDDVFVLNSGLYNELGLHLWGRGVDRVTTLRGFYGGDEVVQPFDVTTGYVHMGVEAMMLRAVPDGVPEGDTKAVHLYVGPNGDRVVTDVRPAVSWFDAGIEGYVYTWQRGPQMEPYREFVNKAGTDRMTTTRTPPAHYDWVRDVGWVNPL